MLSYWSNTSNFDKFPTLTKDISVDVCIIGAGITGIMTAYKLMDSGLKIALIDSLKICSSVTAFTTAKITSQHGLIYKYLINSFGFDFAKAYLESNENAITDISNIIQKENINCNFEIKDNFIYTCSSNYVKKIEDEYTAVTSLGKRAPLTNKTELPFEVLSAIKFENQASFHPLKYLSSIIKILANNKVLIFENTKVTNIKHSKNYEIYANNNTITSKYVVLCTHYPIKSFPGMHFLKMYQDRSYVVGINSPNHNVTNMYISAENPQTSFRPIDKDILLVGSVSHKVGSNYLDLSNIYNNINNYARKIFPNCNTLYEWSNQDCITLDKVPYIGRFSNLLPDFYIATGYNKWGMTSSHVAADILACKILKKPNKYSWVYNSTRFKPIKNHTEMGHMLKESYYSLLVNKIRKSNVSLDKIELDSGGVIDYNGKKVGIYKDKDGNIFAVKPYCKHLGCLLSWNNLEKTWDCPCHGSKYTFEGKVIFSPTTEDLDKRNI